MPTIGDLAGRSDFKAGPLYVSPARRRIGGPTGAVQLQPIEMRVLLFLLDARGRVVTREELFASAWGDAIVGDDSLNRAVARVRKVASETAPGAYHIETIPRTGYRLTGDVLDSPGGELSDTPVDPRSTFTRRAIVTGAISATAIAGAAVWQRARWQGDRDFEDLLDRGAAAFRRDTAIDAEQSVTLLQRAVESRPRSARAWGLLACAYAVSNSYATSAKSTELLEATKQAARKSLSIKPHEPNAEAALTSMEGSLQTRALVEARYREILSRDPRNGYTLDALISLLQAGGYTRESSALNDRALADEPFAPVPLYRRALKLWILGRVGEADQVIERASELWPSHPAVWNARFLILAFTGRAPAALASLDDRDARPTTFSPAADSVWRAALAALDGRGEPEKTSARVAVLRAAGLSPGLAAYGAMIMSALGDADSAYRIIQGFLLSKGTVVMRPEAGSKRVLINYPGWRETQWLFVPPTALVRNDVRFAQLSEEIGLEAYWRARGLKPDFQRMSA